MSKFIDHELTENVVCPHCGYEDADWFEGYDITDGSVENHECGDCGKPFILSVDVTVQFTTEKTSFKQILLEDIEQEERMLEQWEQMDVEESFLDKQRKHIEYKKEKYNNTDWGE